MLLFKYNFYFLVLFWANSLCSLTSLDLAQGDLLVKYEFFKIWAILALYPLPATVDGWEICDCGYCSGKKIKSVLDFTQAFQIYLLLLQKRISEWNCEVKEHNKRFYLELRSNAQGCRSQLGPDAYKSGHPRMNRLIGQRSEAIIRS